MGFNVTSSYLHASCMSRVSFTGICNCVWLDMFFGKAAMQGRKYLLRVVELCMRAEIAL
jgi:hypothetical protein